MNTIHSLKSVTENIILLSKKIEPNTNGRLQAPDRKKSKEIEDLQNELESLRRQQMLRENKVVRSPKIGTIREFCPKTESEYQSSDSEKKIKGRPYMKIKPVHVREFRLDSSISQVVRPLDLLNDPVIKAQWESDESSVKTSNKKNIKAKYNGQDFKNLFNEKSDESDGGRTPVKANNLANVKDFDDFKSLLKDLKVTLNMSNFSSFQDNLDEQIIDLERVIKNYSELDKQIVNLSEVKLVQPKLNNSVYDNNLNNSLDFKRCHSVTSKPEEHNKYSIKLENLKHSSNIGQYTAKLRDLKKNPFDFDSFVFKVKKEFEQRQHKFEEIKEFLI